MDDGIAAREYHERTKHSPASVGASRHFLDWEIRPLPFKIYRGLEPIPLPRQMIGSPVPAIEAVASPGCPSATTCVPDLRTVARLLNLSAGITHTKFYPGGQAVHFRAAPCTGALYHVDLYLVCGDLPGLEAGVYHFAPDDSAVRRLRTGDYRSVVTEATACESEVAVAPAVLVCTSTFWRNAWKYQARAYRHCFWDNGTILANLLAVAAADRVPARVVLGFVDEAINKLLSLDTEREVSLSLVTLGRQSHMPAVLAPPYPPLSLETVPLSSSEVDYPAIRAAHTASCLGDPAAVELWRRPLRTARVFPAGSTFTLRPLPQPPSVAIDRTIIRRGSTRHFARAAVSFEQLSTLVQSATGGISADFLPPETRSDGDPRLRTVPASLNELYLIVNAVDGLPAGAYVYDSSRDALALLREGDVRNEAGFLDLGQRLGADASVNFYLLVDLEPVLDHFGSRGYRAAQLEAAIIGGKLYLAAYALGLGATGLTFFDEDVTRFFSPHGAGKSVMFLVAVGVTRRPGAG